MRKTARLDQILLSLGYATQDQITRALDRQQAQGGRLGQNLIELGVLDENRLLVALSEQYQLPPVKPMEKDVREDLLNRIPPEMAKGDPILPLALNEEMGVLTLAIANPEDEDRIDDVRTLFGAEAVRLKLASDSSLNLLARRFGRKMGGDPVHAGLELPELFAEEEGGKEELLPLEEGMGSPARKVLMVVGSATHKNFLPPVFQKEGCELTVISAPMEAAEVLGKGENFDGILVSQEMRDTFAGWMREGKVPRPDVEVTVFSSVSNALLENPISYELTARTLRSTVQALADSRCAQAGVSPAYGLMATDLEALAQVYRLRRVAIDGLSMALHLLLPLPDKEGGHARNPSEPFGNFSSSLELATRLRFPWRLDWILEFCHGLYTGRVEPGKAHKGREEAALGAQVLALVWFRHNHLPPGTGSQDEAMIALRTGLRETAGRLAPLEMIECYLRLISERGGAQAQAGQRQVLLVGGERIVEALSQNLARMGCQVLTTEDLSDAQTLAQRRPPGAIVLDRDEFPGEVDRFSRVVKLDTPSLLFALTDATDPSMALNLLDIGVDDVFGPPHEFDLMAARINRAIRSRADRDPKAGTGTGQFSATFEVFSFLDLVQTLSQGFKTVRIDLARSTGETAVIYMEKGRILHATCGSSSGSPAVYEVIAWEEDGEFTVHSETDFPEATIADSTESLLMEGCRLLDESKR